MSYTLPPLPYSYDALEPYIDTMTMEIHYSKHHHTYVKNFNTLLEKYPILAQQKLPDLLKNLQKVPEKARSIVRNQGGGAFNHTMFWNLMEKNGGGTPKGMLADAIATHFKSFSEFQTQFNQTAKTVFGSGWAWLCVNQEDKLLITSTQNQDNPLSQNLWPIVGLDVWEHAYYLKYQNRRPDYINAWWHVINWQQAEENYRSIINL